MKNNKLFKKYLIYELNTINV